MNQFHDAQSRLEKQSNNSQGSESDRSLSDSGESSNEELNEESFLSYHIPASINGSYSIEQPKKISAVRMELPLERTEKQAQQMQSQGDLTVVKENTVDGTSSQAASGQKNKENQSSQVLITDQSLDQEQTLAKELQEAGHEQDDGFNANFDILRMDNEDDAKRIEQTPDSTCNQQEESKYEKQEAYSSTSSDEEDFIPEDNMITWRESNKPRIEDDPLDEKFKRACIM